MFSKVENEKFNFSITYGVATFPAGTIEENIPTNLAEKIRNNETKGMPEIRSKSRETIADLAELKVLCKFYQEKYADFCKVEIDKKKAEKPGFFSILWGSKTNVFILDIKVTDSNNQVTFFSDFSDFTAFLEKNCNISEENHSL